ncbi:MAG: tetratricopeptide repeat protein [Methylococcaceae bacterium]|nr:tetratricopeptide repeat protein [Methylococcaceae bacterium]
MKARSLRPTALILAATLLGCGGAEERKADHLKKAISYYEQANSEKASIEFKNVLQIDPKSPQPYYYLGRIEEDKQNFQQAFGLFQKAVELDPNFRDAQFHLARFFLMAKQIDKAEEMLGPVAKEKPTDVEVRMLQIAIDNFKGKTEDALKGLQAIVSEKPDQPDPYVVLAMLRNQHGDLASAEQALAEGLASSTKKTALLSAQAKLFTEMKKFDQAEQAIKTLISTEPSVLQNRLTLAKFYFQLERWSDVETALRAAIRDFPDDTQPVLALVEFLLNRGDTGRAESELQSAITAHPKSLEPVAALSGLLERSKKAEQAEKVLQDFIQANEDTPEAVKAQVALAELIARRGRYADAEKVADEVLKEHPSDRQALLLKGKLALNRKNAQDAIAAFRSILKEQPDATEVLSLLASAFQMDGKPTLAQENLERAVQVKPTDFGLRRNLAQFLVQQNNPAQALDQINEFLKLQPDSLDGLNLKADLLAVGKDAAAYETAIREMKERFPDKPVAAFRLGNLYADQKKYDAALKEYAVAVEKSGGAYDALKALVSIHMELKQGDQALAAVEKVLAGSPRNAGAQQLLGVLKLSQDHSQEGVAALEKAIELNPSWLVPYVNLGAHYEKQNDVEKAVATYQKALATVADDFGTQLDLNVALASLLQRKGNSGQAEQVLREFLAKAENRPEADKTRLVLAELLARNRRGEESDALIAEVLAKQPNDTQALLLKGKLELSRKLPAQAVATFQTLVDQQPNSTEALTMLANAQLANQETGKVQETLERAIRTAPRDFAVRRNLVDFLARQKNLSQALTQTNDFLAQQPDNLDALNLKAELLAMDKQDDAAEAVFKDLRKRIPSNAAVALRLGSLYQGRKKYDLAVTEYDAAQRLSNNSYESLAASASLQMAQEKPDKALAMLKKVISENPKHAGAYQLLAGVNFAQKHEADGVKALNKAIEVKPDWLLPYANLGSYYEKLGQSDEALAIYRKALAVDPKDLNIQLNIARVYEATKQYDKAREVYEGILKANPDQLVAINNLASLLSLPGASADQIKRAAELASRLENSEEPALRDTVAWIRYLNGEVDKAVALQTTVVDKSPQVPVFRYHLGMMYHKQGDQSKAKDQLAKALETKAEFTGSDEARTTLQGLQ